MGLSNTIINLAIYYLLVFLGCYYIIANIIGFLISVLNAYYWNNKYVFARNEKNNTPKKLLKVYISYGSTFLLSNILLYLMVDIWHVSEYIAPIINLCITIPLNFILNKLWAFK